MQIIDVVGYKETRFSTAIALGNFDGVHRGHRDLILKMIQSSKKEGLKSSLLVFDTHTKSILNGQGPKIITTMEQKYNIFRELGIEIIYRLKFDKDLMKLSPEEFVRDILVDKLNVKLVVVGFDYRFGHKASGNASYLKELGEKYGFDVYILEPIYIDGELVSSTRIRNLITQGEVLKINNLLGRNYSIKGKVVPGKNLGNKLGFPTANVETIDNYVIPKNGVYSTKTIIDNKAYKSATSIGFNPTFEEDRVKIESHIIDFNEDIYGKIVELEFNEYLRQEIKFSSIEQLKSQIQEDITKVKSRH